VVTERVGIVVPVFDPVPGLLPELVQSLLQQSCPHWHALLVDDGCLSDVAVVVSGVSNGDPRIEVCRLDVRCGVSGASRHGAGMVRGEWIGFVDQHDLLAPETVERLCVRAITMRTQKLSTSTRTSL
jgi:glycosyltransferase involved in cell wall biosynthesis